jgi:hypothetical protein
MEGLEGGCVEDGRVIKNEMRRDSDGHTNSNQP